MIQKSDPLNLIGKVAVITGAGSGIGLGVAQMLSAYGAAVAIVDVSPKSEAAAQELRDAGRNAAFFQCDVTNEQSVIDTVNAIVAKFGRIDILHMKDMAKNAETQYYTEIGHGNLWWEGIVESAEKAGVKYYVVEQDSWPGDPFDSIRQSSEYIHKYFM